MNADDIIQEFKTNAQTTTIAPIPLMGAITGILEKACGGKANRYLVTKVLTGKTSSRLLTDSEWYAFLCLVQPEKPLGSHWRSARGDEELRQICQILLTRAVDQPGQEKMPF